MKKVFNSVSTVLSIIAMIVGFAVAFYYSDLFFWGDHAEIAATWMIVGLLIALIGLAQIICINLGTIERDVALIKKYISRLDNNESEATSQENNTQNG